MAGRAAAAAFRHRLGRGNRAGARRGYRPRLRRLPLVVDGSNLIVAQVSAVGLLGRRAAGRLLRQSGNGPASKTGWICRK
jgi:hypothetical protein